MPTTLAELSIESPEFLDTIAGASGAPFVEGNAVELLNNGDAFYPRMLEAIEGAQASITIEAYIYCGRNSWPASFCPAGRPDGPECGASTGVGRMADGHSALDGTLNVHFVQWSNSAFRSGC